MGNFAEVVAREIDHPVVEKKELKMTRGDRFAFYKIGPVISISVSVGKTQMETPVILLPSCHNYTEIIIVQVSQSASRLRP